MVLGWNPGPHTCSARASAARPTPSSRSLGFPAGVTEVCCVVATSSAPLSPHIAACWFLISLCSGRTESSRSSRVTPAAASYHSRAAKVTGSADADVGVAGGVVNSENLLGTPSGLGSIPWIWGRGALQHSCSFTTKCCVVPQAKPPKQQGAGDAEEEEEE